MQDAVKSIGDGMRLTLGGFAVYQHPMALVREIARQKKKNLTIVGTVNGNEADLLIGAGCVKRIETSYVGLEKWGLARNFRRAVEAGTLEIVDYPEVLAFDRFRASQDNLSFWPCDYLGGTDVLTYNADIKQFACPLTGKRLYAVPPAAPDVVVIHAVAADERGNVLIPPRHLLPQGLDLLLARSCDHLIVTVEKIVSNKTIRQHSDLTEIPSYRTTAVVEAPWGAHPNSMLGQYHADDNHFREYVEASSDPASFARYLDRYVHTPADHHAYLELIGLKQLVQLREVDALS